jgi:hypothetical protein
MTYTYGDGICCHYFRDVVRESVDVVGHSTGPTLDYQLDVAYDDYTYETS